MTVLDTMSDQELKDAEIIATGVSALRSKCLSEDGPWETQELLDYLTSGHGLPERFARKALWRLTGDGTLHFLGNFSKITRR
jgi:DNA-binding transcriptional regulator PaaX